MRNTSFAEEWTDTDILALVARLFQNLPHSPAVIVLAPEHLAVRLFKVNAIRSYLSEHTDGYLLRRSILRAHLCGRGTESQ